MDHSQYFSLVLENILEAVFGALLVHFFLSLLFEIGDISGWIFNFENKKMFERFINNWEQTNQPASKFLIIYLIPHNFPDVVQMFLFYKDS